MKVEDEEQESGGRKDGTADRTLRSASCPAEPRWTLSLEVVREGGWQENAETRDDGWRLQHLSADVRSWSVKCLRSLRTAPSFHTTHENAT